MSDSTNMSSMSENQIKKTEDWKYLVSLGHESTSYIGFHAVASSVRNRVKQQGKSYKQIVTASGQYQGYRSSDIGNPVNGDVSRAALDILKGSDSSVKDYTMFFGRYGKHDIWYESSKCGSNTPIVAAPNDNLHNVFYKTWGTVHNAKDDKTKDAVTIYDYKSDKWNFSGVNTTSTNSKSTTNSSTKQSYNDHFVKGSPEALEVIDWNKGQNYTETYIKKVQLKIGVKDDGIIGTNTINAIYNYQVKNGLTRDGKWGKGCADFSKLTREFTTTKTSNSTNKTTNTVIPKGKGINPAPLFQKQYDYKVSPYVSKEHYLEMKKAMNGVAYENWDITSSKLSSIYSKAVKVNVGKTTIDSSGCGITAYANLKGISPKTSAEMSMQKGCRIYGKGTAAAFFSSNGGTNAGTAYEALDKVAAGKYLICSMGYGNWCGSKNGGHFILVYGYDGSNIYVSDSYSTKPERLKASKSTFKASYKYGYLF